MNKLKTSRDIGVVLGEYHTYKRDDRKAIVIRNTNGFYVELYEHDRLLESRECYEHSESWAESVAENYVDKMYNADSNDRSPRVNISVHAIELSFDNCIYPEPTREQIAEKLCEYVNNNVFSYSEIRHSNTEQSPSEIMQDELEPINVNSHYINHDIKQSHTVTSNLSTFGELEEAFDDAQKMSKDMSIGRASVEQGGNREENLYNEDKDPLNE